MHEKFQGESVKNKEVAISVCSGALNADLNSPVLRMPDSFFKQCVISQGKSRY